MEKIIRLVIVFIQNVFLFFVLASVYYKLWSMTFIITSSILVFLLIISEKILLFFAFFFIRRVVLGSWFNCLVLIQAAYLVLLQLVSQKLGQRSLAAPTSVSITSRAKRLTKNLKIHWGWSCRLVIMLELNSSFRKSDSK